VYLCRGVSAPAAQRVAAVRAVGVRSPSTLAMSRADAAAVGVRSAVVGRALDVHQLRVADRLAPHPLLAPAEQRRRGARRGGGGDDRARRDLDRQLVLVLEGVADASEQRQRLPARPDGARTRHAMTATLGRHQLRHDLPRTSRQTGRISVVWRKVKNVWEPLLYTTWSTALLLARLMGQHCFARWRLSSSVTLPAGRPACRQAVGRPTLQGGPVVLRPVRATHF